MVIWEPIIKGQTKKKVTNLLYKQTKNLAKSINNIVDQTKNFLWHYPYKHTHNMQKFEYFISGYLCTYLPYRSSQRY